METNAGNEHEVLVENAKEIDSQTAQDAQVQSDRGNEAVRQMCQDQLVICIGKD